MLFVSSSPTVGWRSTLAPTTFTERVLLLWSNRATDREPDLAWAELELGLMRINYELKRSTVASETRRAKTISRPLMSPKCPSVRFGSVRFALLCFFLRQRQRQRQTQTSWASVVCPSTVMLGPPMVKFSSCLLDCTLKRSRALVYLSRKAIEELNLTGPPERPTRRRFITPGLLIDALFVSSSAGQQTIQFEAQIE